MATQAWFDYNVYMAHKLVQLQTSEPDGNWTMGALVNAFYDAGFAGAEGAQEHFLLFGANEDVAPNTFFNATEYYEAKAAQFYNKAPSAVTPLETANMQAAIHAAGMNAWTHYQRFGTAEGVNPSNAFDTDAYMNAKLTAMQAAEPSANWDMTKLEAAFQNAGLSALEHFALYGGKGAGEVAESYNGATIPDAYAVPADQQVPSVEEGETYTLTTGMDTFTGTAANDSFIAAPDNNIATLNLADSLDGGAGTDTLTLYGDVNLAAFGTADIKNIEIVKVVGSTGANAINANAYEDVQEVQVDKLTGAQAVNALTFQKVVLDNAVGGNVTVNFTGTNTAADTAVVGLNNASFGTSTLGLGGAQTIEGLTLELTGTNTFGAQAVGNITAAAATSLTLTGSGSLEAGFTATANHLAKVDASATTGGVDLLLTAGDLVAAGATITGGSGDDDLSFVGASNTVKLSANLGAGDDTLTLNGNANALVAAGSTVNGGDGADTLIVNSGGTALTTAAQANMFSGFETLQVQGVTSYQHGLIDGINTIVVADAATATTATFTNAASGVSYLVTAHDAQADTVSVTLANNANPSASVSLVLDNQAETAGTGANLLVNTNAHALNLTSGGNLTNGVFNAVSLVGQAASTANLTKVNVTGEADFNLTTGTTAGLTYIDASAATGDVTVNAGLATAPGKVMNIITGSGQDTITASTTPGVRGSSLIEAGKGADRIILDATVANNPNDTLVLKAGDSNIDGFDYVTGFATSASDDTIDLSAFNFAAALQNVATGVKAATIDTTSYDAAAVMAGYSVSVNAANATNFFVDAGGAQHGVVTQAVPGGGLANGVFVFIDANQDGNWDANDQVLLVGTDDGTALADANFIF